ncbi:MAG: hypothetical protein EOO40_11980, partial [Deltaproteobacteria bacterium]
FIENRIYKRIEAAKTAEKVHSEVREGLHPFAKAFVRELSEADIDKLLELRIRRISAFDIAKNRADIDDIVRVIKRCHGQLRQLTKTAVGYLEGLLKKYAKDYPRRTRVEVFVAIDRKKVARQNLKVSYDRSSGFFGTEVRGDDYSFAVSEYDLILAINKQGGFRIMTAQPRVLVGDLLWCEPFDPEAGKIFTMVYRDAKRLAYAKQVHILKFIRNREYHLCDEGSSLDFLQQGAVGGRVIVSFAPAARQRLAQASFDLGSLTLTSLAARGTKLAPKPVSKLRVEPARAKR